MKIVFFASDNSQKSGAFLSLVKLASILQEDYSIDPLIIIPKDGDGIRLLVDNNLPYKYIPSYNWIVRNDTPMSEELKAALYRSIKNIQSFRAITKFLKDIRPDVVHINTTYTYIGAIAAYTLKIPVVWHLREYLEEDQGMHICLKGIGYKIIGRATTIVTISNDLRRKYLGVFPPKKLLTIYNGIDVGVFYNAKREVLKGPIYSFLCIGGLTAGKNQRLLIEACTILRDRGTRNFVLKIVGEGCEKSRLIELVEQFQMSDYVSFEGFQSNTKQYYDKADIFFMVSNREAFGRVTIEAMLSGALVIGSNSGATGEIIEDGKYGYLFDLGDSTNLADKIELALRNPEQSKEIAKAGQVMAYHKFSATRNAENIYQLYKHILEP